jgi:uncharacterized membrane protein YcaP (DUF421 family)
MVAGIFTLGTPIWEIAIRSAVVYLAVLVGFRIFGKREVGQLTLADLVLLILIANAVQNAMVGPDASLEGGLFAALILLLVNLAVGYLRVRSPRLDRAFQGHPIPLVTRGQVIEPHLRREGLDDEDLERVAHENQLKGLADIDSAWLETDGTISVVPKSSPPLRNSTHRPRSRRRAKGLRKPQT